MYICTGRVSRFSIPLYKCVDSGGFRPLPFSFVCGNTLSLALLSVFHQICSYLTIEDSSRCPFFWLWLSSAPLPLTHSRRDILSGLDCRATLSYSSCCAPQPALWHRRCSALMTRTYMHTPWPFFAVPVSKVLCRKSSRVSVGGSFLPAHSGILGAGHLPLLFWTKGTKPMSHSQPVGHLVVNFGHLNRLDLNQ